MKSNRMRNIHSYRTNFDLVDKLLPVSMASSGLKKMLHFIILYIPKSVSENG